MRDENSQELSMDIVCHQIVHANDMAAPDGVVPGAPKIWQVASLGA
jgi:hypothetical protein